MAGNSKDSKILAYKDMINQLNKTISAQTELIQSLQKTLEAGRLEKENLRQQIEYLTKKLFGTSSEKRKDIDGQLNLFDHRRKDCLARRITLWCTGNIRGCLRQNNLRLRHADAFHGKGRGNCYI